MSIEIDYYVTANDKCPARDFIDKLSVEARARTIKTFETVEILAL